CARHESGGTVFELW
nr:immunoglobulin heavy chain junction region [Macaca mulatta]MOW85152.1 immunoglobulin heavy chain junction region [Macaca mulatta]